MQAYRILNFQAYKSINFKIVDYSYLVISSEDRGVISNATDLQIITAIALDPVLLIGLFLFIFEKVRSKYYVVFFWVAFIHIALFIGHPIKDEFWINFSITQVVIDAIVLLGLGLLIKSRNKNKTISDETDDT